MNESINKYLSHHKKKKKNIHPLPLPQGGNFSIA